MVDEEVDEAEGTRLSYKARKIIAKIRSSNRLWESLQAQPLAARIPLKRPILDMPVRWNSTHAMLVRLFLQLMQYAGKDIILKFI